MIRLSRTALAGVFLVVSTASAGASVLTADQWREDLATLDAAIRRDHKSPFHTQSEAVYSARIDALHDAIPGLEETEILVEMASIVAAINDGHTRLTGWHRNPDWGFRSYPLSLYWFADGLYVRQAHLDLGDLVGARVLRIGDLTAEEAKARIEAVVAADNRFGEREEGPGFLISPEVMAALGILDADTDHPYELEKDGRTWRPRIETLDGPWPGWMRGFIAADDWVDAKDASPGPVPRWRRHPDKTFWTEYDPAHQLLYVQQNQVRNDPQETLEAFYARVWDLFEANDVAKLVLDVRLNGGGNNYLNKPALTTMVRADATAQTFTIIGRQTFSACQNLVNELSRWTDTIFVGEPTSERVNFYGDTRSTELPHSRLVVRASWLWWQNLDPRDTRDALYPDLAADLNFADYASNRDPAMDLIRGFEGLLDVDGLIAMFDADGPSAVREALAAMAADPAYRHRNVESEINTLGYRLMGERRLDDAITVFGWNVELFPGSWNVYDSLGEAYENSGDLERALGLFERSLELNPQSPTGRQAVQRIRARQAGHDPGD